MMSSIRWAATVLLAAGAVLTHDPARASAVSVSGSGCSADGLCLRVTVAVDDGDPAQCGTQTDLVAISGDIVNYCYIVTNGTNVTLRAHSLSDSANGTLFEYFLHDLPPGASYQYNRRETVSTSMQSTASWTATDAAPAYASSAAAFDFVDISASGTPLNLGDNDAAFVQLPFPFVYYGTSFETLCVNNNGLVIPGFVSPFGPQACGGFSDHAQIPVPFPVYADNPFIAPLWTDLSAVYGNVYVGTVGEAPDRRYVIEWSGVSSDYQVQDTGTATFEIVLSEADGTIAYQYQDVTFDDPTAPQLDDGGFATVGLQYSQALYGDYSFDTPVLASGSAILWTPQALISETASAAVSVAAETPDLAVLPEAFAVSADSGSSTSATLSIRNNGSYRLTWSLDSAVGGSRAHFPRIAPGSVPPGDATPTISRRFRPVPSIASESASGPEAYGFLYGDDGAYQFARFPGLVNPADIDPIAEQPQRPIFGAGDFIGNDFSAEFVVGYFDDGSSRLYAVSTADGSLTDVGGLSEPEEKLRWSALRWDSTQGQLYGVAVVDAFTTSLFTVDPATGAKTKVGDFPFHGDPGDGRRSERPDVRCRLERRPAGRHRQGQRRCGADRAARIFAGVVDGSGLRSRNGCAVLQRGICRPGDLHIRAEPVHDRSIVCGPGLGRLVQHADGGLGVCGRLARSLRESHPHSLAFFDTPSGTAEVGQTSSITVNFDASNLSGGTYSTNVCVRSDAPFTARASYRSRSW